MADGVALLVSCEHGGNEVPEKYGGLFRGQSEVLESHRGCDLGILPLSRRFATAFRAPLEVSTVTRLLVDLNRSLHSPTLFSPLSRRLSREAREEVLALYYHPYRKRVRNQLDALLDQGGRVLHLSVHSFTPVLNGQKRHADVGLLYDPGHPLERDICLAWQRELAALAPELRVRRNYPYRGVSDSLVTTLRRVYPAGLYMGVELEVNQALPLKGGEVWSFAQEHLVGSLTRVLHPGVP